jgi:hypothetical protein
MPTLGAKIDAFIHKWVFWRIFTLASWYWLCGTIVNGIANKEVLLTPWWLFFMPFVTMFYLIARQMRIWLVVYIPYWIAFPFFMVPLLIWRTKKASRMVYLTVKTALGPATSLIASIVILFALCLVWAVLSLVETESAIYTLVIIEVALNIMALTACLRWASDPLRPFLTLTTFADWLHTKYDESTSKPTANQTPEERKKQIATNIMILGWYEKAVSWWRRQLEALTQRTIVPVFTVVLIGLFFITVFGYAMAILAAQRLTPPAFDNFKNPSAMKCVVLSISTITTAPISNVTPATWLGDFLYATELLCTFLVVSVFFAMFSAAMGVHGTDRINELNSLCKKVHDWTAIKRAKLALELTTSPQEQGQVANPPTNTTPNSSSLVVVPPGTSRDGGPPPEQGPAKRNGSQ